MGNRDPYSDSAVRIGLQHFSHLRTLQRGLLCVTIAAHTYPRVRLSCSRQSCRMMICSGLRKGLPGVPREDKWMCFPKC